MSPHKCCIGIGVGIGIQPSKSYKDGQLGRFSIIRLEINLCYSCPTPLTRAPREGQGPSIKY